MTESVKKYPTRRYATGGGYYQTLTCFGCGKPFVSTPEWMYKRNRRTGVEYFCSYTCFAKRENDRKQKRQSGLKQNTRMFYDTKEQRYKSIQEVTEEWGVPICGVREAWKNGSYKYGRYIAVKEDV